MTSPDALLALPLTELRKRIAAEEVPVTPGLIQALKKDGRTSAQALASRLVKLQEDEKAETQRLERLLKYDKELFKQGLTLIAGVDEAGVAPLAGPVVAGAVILPQGYTLRGLDDSKKILNEKKREALAEIIKKDAIAWASGWASEDEVDSLNIYHASLLAMRRAVEGLSVSPEFCLVDARTIPGTKIPQRGIIHGDALSLSIAAASVIAKTSRDGHMNEMDKKYPGYGFARHKGYPTPEHQKALKNLGAVAIHRRSFALVKEALAKGPSSKMLISV